MKQRALGNQGLRTSALGLGCMGMSFAYGTADEKESLATITRALDLGVTLFDTADMYGPFTNEQLVGKALRGRRDEILIATKFGFVTDASAKERPVNGSPDYVRAACDASLKRLGVDTIDLYYQHRVDPNVPIEDTVGAMSQLVEAGKVRFLGLSEAAPQTIRRAHATHPISVLQTEYSLWSREPEDEILPALRELGIGFVPYSPLGRGFLSGRIKSFDDLAPDDFRRTMPRLQGDNFQKNLDLVAKVKAIAEAKGITPGQLALAWVLAQGDAMVPIPGTTHRTHLEENLDAINVELTQDDLDEIAEAMPVGAAAGQRYPEARMKTVNL